MYSRILPPKDWYLYTINKDIDRSHTRHYRFSFRTLLCLLGSNTLHHATFPSVLHISDSTLQRARQIDME